MGIAGGPEGSLLGGGEKLFGVFANAGGGGGAAGTALFFFPLKVENSAFLADDVSTLPIFCCVVKPGLLLSVFETVDARRPMAGATLLLEKRDAAAATRPATDCDSDSGSCSLFDK